MRSSYLVGFVVGLALAVTAAQAETLEFSAHLTGRGEVPSNDSGGKGDVDVQVDSDTHVLTYKAAYKGLSGPATMAHFHGPAKGGATAPPVIAVDDPSSPISGRASVTDAQIAELKKGLWYFNVHTAAYPDGEIRGQLKREVDWAAEDSPTGMPDISGERRMPASIGSR